MIRPHHIGVDVGGFYVFLDRLAHEEVIDAPADVAFAGAAPVAPPGVELGRVWIEDAEGVDKASVEEVLEAFTFFVGKAFFAFVWFWPREVELGVSHIQVPAEDHRLSLLEFLAMRQESRVPGVVTEIDPFQAILGIGGVDGDEVKVFILRRDDAAFGEAVAPSVVDKIFSFLTFFTQSIDYTQRFGLTKDRRARVAFFLSRVPVLFILFKVYLDLLFVGFGLLDTEHIWVMCFEKILQFTFA